MKTKNLQVVMLPTEESHGVIMMYDNKIGIAGEFNPIHKSNGCIRQHLYLVSDSEIKECDWYINERDNSIHKFSNKSVQDNMSKYCSKIEAATDKSLRYKSNPDGQTKLPLDFDVPQIPESFIKNYVEAKGTITEVLVEYIVNCPKNSFRINCDIDKDMTFCDECIVSPKLSPNNTVIIK